MHTQPSYVHNMFHALHAIPEVAMQEYKTARLLADEVKRLGFTVLEGVGGTGIIATMKGDLPGAVIALRADMDALVYQVDGQTECRHTCGHDAHSAMVLATAKNIAERRLRSGTAVIIFQPAEEPILGALAMIDSGHIDKQGIDELYGIHLRPVGEMEVGKATPALYHSASGRLRITISGKDAPLNRPDLGVNAVEAAVLAVHAINTVHMDPTIHYSVKPTHMTAGQLFPDRIPTTAVLIADLKHQDTKMYAQMHDKTIRAVEAAIAAIGATATFESINYVPGAAYNEDAVDTARSAIIQALGESGCLPPHKTTGGDDFHYFVRHLGCKATYIGLGADASPGLHHQDMCFNTDCLDHGVKILTNIISKKLGFLL